MWPCGLFIKINSKDGLNLNAPFKVVDVVVLIITVFEDDDTYYPQIFLEKYWFFNLIKYKNKPQTLLTNKDMGMFLLLKYET